MSEGHVEGFAERLSDFIARVEYQPVVTAADREAVFRLRYDAYRREGVIAAHRSRLFTDALDGAPNCHIVALRVDGRLAASIRVHVADQLHPIAPVLDVFGDMMRPRIEAGAMIVDPTRFVADHEASKRYPYLPYATVRCGFMACEHFGADLGLATVRAEHRAFYKRLFLMDQLSEPRAYPGLTKPIIVMGVDYLLVRDKIISRNPGLDSTEAQRHALFAAPRVERRELPARAPAVEIAAAHA